MTCLPTFLLLRSDIYAYIRESAYTNECQEVYAETNMHSQTSGRLYRRSTGHQRRKAFLREKNSGDEYSCRRPSWMCGAVRKTPSENIRSWVDAYRLLVTWLLAIHCLDPASKTPSLQNVETSMNVRFFWRWSTVFCDPIGALERHAVASWTRLSRPFQLVQSRPVPDDSEQDSNDWQSRKQMIEAADTPKSIGNPRIINLYTKYSL